MRGLADNAIFIGLMLIVIFSALAHGVVEPWSFFIFELTAALLVLMWVIKVAMDKKFTLVIPHTAWPLAALILVGLVQCVSWNDGAGIRQSLSFDVEATRGTTLVLCSLLALSLLAANFLTGEGRLRALLHILIIFAVVMAVIGLAQRFSGSDGGYWLRPSVKTGFGPFINRDHFAGYMELFIGLPVALIATRCVSGEKTMVYGAAAMLMGVAAVFTLSRGGMISILAEMIFLAAMGYRHYQTRRARHEPGAAGGAMSAVAVVIILAAIVTGVVWMGAEPVINRVATGDPNSFDLSKAQTFYGMRGEIWEDTWTMIRHNPLIGVGLGAYETAYPTYALDSGMRGVVAEAHNDYLQVLADAGVIGAGLALWFVLTLFRAFARGARSPNPLMAAIALGGGAGLFGLLLHSFFDFNLHLPSHAVVFLLLSMVISNVGDTVEKPVSSKVLSAPVASGVIREVSS